MFSWDDVEDIVIAQNLADRAHAQAKKREIASANDLNRRLGRTIGWLRNESNFRGLFIRADRAVAQHFIAEYVRLSGAPEETAQAVARKLHAETLDKLVQEELHNGSLEFDPRGNKPAPAQNWWQSISVLDRIIAAAFLVGFAVFLWMNF